MKITRQAAGQASESPGSSAEQAFAASSLGLQLREVLAAPATSSANRAIADFLLRNPVRATAWGIEELAANAQTSTASLSRFARLLGLNGFAALRAEVAEVLQGVLQPVEKLRTAVRRQQDGGAGAGGLLDESLQATLRNLDSTARGLAPDVLKRIAARLSRAESVYVMGFGFSAHLGAMLALGLQPFCKQLINVVEFGGTEVAAGRLMSIGARDVLLAISLPRYSSDMLRLARYSKDHGAHIVAITDSMAAPLAALADETLLAAAVHPVLPSSSVAAMLVIEALESSLMLTDASAVQQAERLTEAISAYLVEPRARRGRRTPSE